MYRTGLQSSGALGDGTSQIWSQWPICRIVAVSVKGRGSHSSALAICLALWFSTRALIDNTDQQ